MAWKVSYLLQSSRSGLLAITLLEPARNGVFWLLEIHMLHFEGRLRAFDYQAADFWSQQATYVSSFGGNYT